MAAVTTTPTTFRVELTTGEKIASLRGDLELPLAGVRSVTVEPDALCAVRGLRAPGLGVPGRAKIGTWRGRGGTTFAVARRGRAAVVVELEGARYDRVVVCVPDLEATATQLRQAVQRQAT